MVDTNEPDPSARSFTPPGLRPPCGAASRTPAAHSSSTFAVNGEYRAVSPSFANNGSGAAQIGGDAPAGALSLIGIKNSAELFLSAMIFDGVFERFPTLKCISMEHAAYWLPSWLQGLDMAAPTFARLQPQLGKLSRCSPQSTCTAR